ncbi:flagellar type III secretion system pore protein FliP [Buchnera aphidicola]|uniref:flagellar type III secretion system pore protein FliP n=1 Tax=Buchnera aphidicola TaxID=9 RepID=UPI0020933251|nr:flagellar type III secretion system pore protein FliP [Buchnera aphidicola]USS94185.1 flagellar type III secretion system pore protein FliP [Buchnera aphidicola (Sipha maydis)]
MIFRSFLFLFLCFFPSQAYANNLDVINNFWKDNAFLFENTVSIKTFIIVFLLTCFPFFLLAMTCFTRIIIVFGILRNAMGTPYLPSNHILISLSLFLTFFIMEPVFKKIYSKAYVPYVQKKITFDVACQRSWCPLRVFMLKQMHKKDLLFFSKLAHINSIKDIKDVPVRVLIPSFIMNEIKTAFKIGVTIFIPFLIIDLLVSSVLMSLGMMMVPPSTISLPLKLIIFVMSNGWQLLMESLVYSFRT